MYRFLCTVARARAVDQHCYLREDIDGYLYFDPEVIITATTNAFTDGMFEHFLDAASRGGKVVRKFLKDSRHDFAMSRHRVSMKILSAQNKNDADIRKWEPWIEIGAKVRLGADLTAEVAQFVPGFPMAASLVYSGLTLGIDGWTHLDGSRMVAVTTADAGRSRAERTRREASTEQRAYDEKIREIDAKLRDLERKALKGRSWLGRLVYALRKGWRRGRLRGKRLKALSRSERAASRATKAARTARLLQVVKIVSVPVGVYSAVDRYRKTMNLDS